MSYVILVDYNNGLDKMDQLQDDEINLIQLFKTIWNDKWIVTAFVTLGVLVTSVLLLIKEPIYNSMLKYHVNITPPFTQKTK